MRKLLVFLGLVFLVSGISIGMIYQNHNVVKSVIYVSTEGDDQNPGTIDQPLLSLKAAADKATSGTTVNIRGGIYDEPLIIQHDGTKNAPIFFQSYQDEKVTISGRKLEDDPEDIALVEIDGHSYITVHGLTIENLTTKHDYKTNIGILITGNSHNITLSNNTVQDISTTVIGGNAHGIAVYGNEKIDTIDIQHNTLTNLKLGLSEALVINGDVSNFSIKENHIYETDNIAIDIIGYEEIANDTSQDYARNGVIIGNNIHNNSSYHNPSYAKDYSAGGIYVDGGKHITIKNNQVYQNDIGIEATSEHKDRSAEYIKILNNTVYENAYTGISIGGYDADRGGTTHSLISKNILTDNDTIGLEGGQLLFQYYTHSNKIESNEMTASSSGLFISHEYEGNTNTIFENNKYYLKNHILPRWLWNNQEVNSLKDFQKLSGNKSDAVIPD